MFSFLIGTMVGGSLGVVFMCVFQINRDERKDDVL